MSQLYKEKNNETAFQLFNKKVVYTSAAANSEYPNLIDFLAEKMMYGRVNRLFVPITIPQTRNKLKSFPSKSRTTQNLKALNFVVDAFKDLEQQFDKCRLLGKIDASDPYLSSLKIYKAYVDPRRYYQKYLSKLNNVLVSDPNIDSKNIKDFNMLADNMTKTMESAGRVNPITYPAFIKSRKTPINVSGLAIEIADLDASNDDEKINLFVNSKNWDFYLNTCRTYGFMVDKNVPWRLVADIGSQPMLEYAKKYNLTNTDQILINCYETAAFNYYNSFTQNMLDLYYTIKPRSIDRLIECNGKTKLERTRPKEYKNTERLQESYGQENFLVLYCKLRFSEEESHYTEEEMRSLINETIQMSNIKSQSFAINRFEKNLNKTFDYQGSLGYYVKKNRAQEEKAFAERERQESGTASATGTTGY
tara:strand:- start:1548 stop:2807 length:1260 start_codon:yes stop_codon:yes gene_type:complete